MSQTISGQGPGPASAAATAAAASAAAAGMRVLPTHLSTALFVMHLFAGPCAATALAALPRDWKTTQPCRARAALSLACRVLVLATLFVALAWADCVYFGRGGAQALFVVSQTTQLVSFSLAYTVVSARILAASSFRAVHAAPVLLALQAAQWVLAVVVIVRVGLRGVAHGGPVHVAFYALSAAIATTWLALALFAPQTEDSGPVRKTRPPVHQDPRYVAAVLLAAQLPALVVCALPRARDPNGLLQVTMQFVSYTTTAAYALALLRAPHAHCPARSALALLRGTTRSRTPASTRAKPARAARAPATRTTHALALTPRTAASSAASTSASVGRASKLTVGEEIEMQSFTDRESCAKAGGAGEAESA